ncbi:hypothetical protein GOBAR_AA11093 [Gossypium barbadense]|uniref:Uncharacterized protein n=1 Tax=Gossypium barbadense TaxID=3634 RepID=A0A2P5Y1U2_GOSBA|nr:hypothetical protein GOBAR_AA11093 [Gossypium barbadense]
MQKIELGSPVLATLYQELYWAIESGKMSISSCLLLLQFGYRQQILPAPRDLKKLFKVNMWGKNDENWREMHKDYI